MRTAPDGGDFRNAHGQRHNDSRSSGQEIAKLVPVEHADSKPTLYRG